MGGLPGPLHLQHPFGCLGSCPAQLPSTAGVGVCPCSMGGGGWPRPQHRGSRNTHSQAPGTQRVFVLVYMPPLQGPLLLGPLGLPGEAGRQAGRRGCLIPDLQEPGAGQRAPQGAWPDPPLTPPGLGAVQITSGSLPVSSSSPAQQVQILGQLEGEGAEEGGILVE